VWPFDTSPFKGLLTRCIKFPSADSFVYLCAELSCRSEQKTLNQDDDVTGSWHAQSLAEQVMLRNLITGQNGEDQLLCVICHVQLGGIDLTKLRAPVISGLLTTSLTVVVVCMLLRLKSDMIGCTLCIDIRLLILRRLRNVSFCSSSCVYQQYFAFRIL